jgi:hypothetical protein
MNDEPFMNINFSFPPYNYSHSHHWTDFFELLCLTQLDGEFSIGDMYDFIRQELKDSSRLVQVDDSESDEEVDASVISEGPAQKDDYLEIRVKEYIKLCGYRAKAYGELYPFEVEREIIRRKKTFTDTQKLYVFLLACSSLGCFKKSISDLTKGFELLSLESLRTYLSDRAKVYSFGANTYFPEPYKTNYVRYTGNLFDKVKSLAKDLNARLAVEKNSFGPNNNGDGGLDIVAWYPFGDIEGANIILFAQCKCSPNWKDTRFSSAYSNWRSYIHINHPPVNLSMIPFCYRKSEGNWQDNNVSDVVIFDRQRLLEALNGTHEFFQHTNAIKIIDELLQVRIRIEEI